MSAHEKNLVDAINNLRVAALSRLARIRRWDVSIAELREIVKRDTDEVAVAELRRRPRQPVTTSWFDRIRSKGQDDFSHSSPARRALGRLLGRR